MRLYSVDGLKVAFFGADLTDGLAVGTFLSVTRNAPTWTQKVNGIGGVVRMYNPDRSGFVSLQVDAESKEHQLLVTLANADAVSRSIVGPFLVRDTSTREVSYFNKTYISTIPPLEKGTTSTVFTWVFNFETAVRQSFDFNANVVP